jgi:hypothetical protein
MALRVRRMLRPLPDLGASKIQPPFGSESVRRTCRLPASRSRLRFPAPHASSHGHDIEGFEPVPAGTCGLDEGTYLLAIQGPYLFSLGSRGLDQAGHVAGYQPVVRGLLERLAQSSADMEHALGREPGV